MWKTASILMGTVLVLLTLGIVMLASTSSVHGEAQFQDALFFTKRQLVALAIGIIALFAVSRIDYQLYKKFCIPLAVVSVVLLVIALIPGLGLEIKGSKRWIRMGPLNFQPSELAKPAMILLMSWYMSRMQRRAKEFAKGLATPLCLLGLFAGLIFLAPDFGTTVLVAAVGMAIMFIGGTRFGYLLTTGALGAGVLSLFIMQDPIRWRRIVAFVYPQKYAMNEAYQLIKAIEAFFVGGPWGVGFGQSLQKQFYLPESHTDFIFAIIGEELGLLASLSVVLLFVVFFVCGLRISLRAPDVFGKLVAAGITLMITLQAVFNIAVVTGCIPTKGLPLPFISYGGSSMVVTLAMVGMLVNIALQTGEIEGDTPAIKDRVRRL